MRLINVIMAAYINELMKQQRASNSVDYYHYDYKMNSSLPSIVETFRNDFEYFYFIEYT